MTFKFPYPYLLAAVFGFAVWTMPAGAVQFRLLGWAAADTNLQFDKNGKATPTSVFTNDFSPLYEFMGETSLVLYKMVEHEGKPRKQVACTIAIPAGATKGLIILTPGDDSKAVDRKVLPDQFGFVSETAPLIYDYIWLDDSAEARPPGTIEFRNLSGLPIALQIEGNHLVLPPQAKAQVPIVEGTKRMAFKAAAQLTGRWKVFASNPLPTRGPERMLVILRDGPPVFQKVLPPGEPNISMISLYDWHPRPAPADDDAPPTLASSK